MPVVLGRKTARERFAGATNTLTLEGMMRDGKALQMGTSHELGQNFARAFDISYLSEQGRQELCWTTSWGSSTRMVGGLIMCHGDDNGLRVPPRLAPIQSLVMVVKDGEGVREASGGRRRPRGTRRPGGARRPRRHPVRPPRRRRRAQGHTGPDRDRPPRPRRGAVTVARRIAGGKTPVPLDAVADLVAAALDEDQRRCMPRVAHRDAHTTTVATIEEAAEAARPAGPGSRGRRSVPRARRRWPSPRSRCGASPSPTGRCRSARTSPGCSPSSGAPTDGA